MDESFFLAMKRLGQISNRATPCCVSCWWKLRRSRYSVMCDGATGLLSGEVERSPKLLWPEPWRLVCTGCGAEDGIAHNWKASVRMWDSLEILVILILI